MRLAFAVAVHTDPEVLLIDEVLAVGDIAFQRKCLERIAAFKEAGAAIVLVSHDADLIRRVCDDVLWLRDGQTAALGTADEVMARYVAEITEETHRRTPAHREPLRVSTGDTLRVNENRFGSFELEITDVRLLDPSGSPAAELDSGDPLTVEITYRANEPVPSPIFGVRLVREDGAVCCDLSTRSELDMRTVTGSGRLRLNVRRLDLGRGSYFVDVGAYERNWSHAYDYHWHAYSFDIRSSEPGDGLLRPPHAWTLDATSVDANATAEAAADPSTSRPR